jgi:hypothetical protein
VTVPRPFAFDWAQECLPIVTGSAPRAGQRTQLGSTVTLRTAPPPCPIGSPSVLKGNPVRTLPSFIGQSLPAALRWLDRRDLLWTVAVPRLSGGQARTLFANYVIGRQRPAAGARLRTGTLGPNRTLRRR